jgi:hypothetical protein
LHSCALLKYIFYATTKNLSSKLEVVPSGEPPFSNTDKKVNQILSHSYSENLYQGQPYIMLLCGGPLKDDIRLTLISLFPLIFLSKHISLYALGRLKWILDIIWPLNQLFKLKNQRNWLRQVWMWKFWNVINCILLH